MKTQWWLAGSLLVIVIGVAGWGGGCGISGLLVGRAVIKHELNERTASYRFFKMCSRNIPLVEQWEQLVKNKKYLILLQNNTELRPSGGFMGSYAKIQTDEQGIKDILVEDIYVPDGQIAGHVEPPYPIQEAFRQGWWRLRDSNWDPDFAAAGATINWFFEQGGEKNNDGIVAVNLEVIKKWLEIMGEIKLETYPETVNSNNLNQIAQRYAEVDFHPGSTQKRDFLGAVGVRLWEETKYAGWNKWIRLAKLAVEELDKGQVMVWFKDQQTEQWMARRGWDGGIERQDKRNDYLYVVEANLGTNKANCCIERQVAQKINGLTEQVTIKWTNNNPQSMPQPPEFWGGDYYDYVRVLIPGEDKLKEVIVEENKLREMTAADFSGPNSLRQGISEDVYNVQRRGDLQEIGFWAKVGAGKEKAAKVIYERNSEWKPGEVIEIKHQPGITGFSYQLIIDGKMKRKMLVEKDESFIVK